MSERPSIVYALREVGGYEVRYIGVTAKPIADRFRQHQGCAGVPGLSPWLRANECEIVRLAEFACGYEARAVEKLFIALFARLGHRLFNRAHNPNEPDAPADRLLNEDRRDLANAENLSFHARSNAL